MRAVPRINYLLCDRCGACVVHCRSHAVEMLAQGPVIVRPEDCTYCTDCETVCPQAAIACPFEIRWDAGA